jgi:hypothetical protein
VVKHHNTVEVVGRGLLLSVDGDKALVVLLEMVERLVIRRVHLRGIKHNIREALEPIAVVAD